MGEPSTSETSGSGMVGDAGTARPFDLAGIGIGPFNLSLAALADGIPELSTVHFDQTPEFSWHPGLLIEGATLQVPFLADLVSLADPTNPWSFLSYLRAQERLFPFYFAERFHIERTEYDAYCRWVAAALAVTGQQTDRRTGLRFGHQVDAVRWHTERQLFELDFTQLQQETGEAVALGRAFARHVALGIGTAPHTPEAFVPLQRDPGVPVVHSADYLPNRERLLAAGHVTVIGSGQSGAEVFLDLLHHRPAGRERLHWLTRSPAFAPMEYSKLGLEHFTPDYTRYFHRLPESVRDELLTRQDQLHKAIDHETLAAVHTELYHRAVRAGWPDAVLTPAVGVRTAGRLGPSQLELHLEHHEQRTRSRLVTDAVVLATGYQERPQDRLLAALDPYIRRDAAGRPQVDDHHRMVLDPCVTGSLHLQNAERHTHGVGAPDLGLAAHRSAVILNSVTGREAYPLPKRSAFTSFGIRADPHAPQREGGLRQSGGVADSQTPLTRSRS